MDGTKVVILVADDEECQSEWRQRLPTHPSSERRASVRFPLALDVRYTVAGRRGSMESGSGRTIDLSSSGLRLATVRPLPVGQRVDVSIDWPVLLDGRVQLQLVATGIVAWSRGTKTALRIQRHQLRTRGVEVITVSRQESVG